ncbi:MAG: hypothetical protein JXA99_10520 [Candidatus Lokiarchaeota archaeon]|nr:hypothetical protein [Candidatus Lokiarchaeota archaeon]
MEGNKVLKGLVIGLVIFIALNFVFQIICYAIEGVLEAWFQTLNSAYNILEALFGFIIVTPTNGITIANASSWDMTTTLLFLVFPMLTAIISAIIAGRFAEDKAGGFLAWFLVALISGIILFIGVIIEIEGDFNLLSTMDYIIYLGYPILIGFGYSFLAIFSSESSAY